MSRYVQDIFFHFITAHYQIKRTCTDDFEVNFFMVNHACMTEGHRHGHMCFCEEDECNSAMPSSNKLIPAQAIGSFLVKTFSAFVPFDIYHHSLAMGVFLWSLCLLIIYQIIYSNLLSCSSLFPDIDTVIIMSTFCAGRFIGIVKKRCQNKKNHLIIT